jgi:hypothetical protein
MPTFKGRNELYKYIQDKVVETMKDEVADAVRFEEQKQIEKVVYEAYEQPYVYERRKFNNGGLQDTEMMVAVVEKQGNSVVLSVINMAKGADQEDLYIAPLIEYGDNAGYGEYQFKYNRDHTSWKYLQSRPFTQETIKALQRSGVHIQALKEGLEKRGFDVR